MKSVVLLSGGLDSATNLYQAHKETEVVLALTFDYGQRVFNQEMRAAHNLCESLGILHKVIAIPWVREFGHSSLIDESIAVPQGQKVVIDDLEQSHKTAAAVWVPNRNGILLNIAAGFAESLGAELVVPGFNIEEAQTFPDNSENFLQALTQSFVFSTANKVRVKCFTINKNKTEIVGQALNLGVPIQELWSCYLPGEKWCGTCESCQRFKRALEANHQLSQLKDHFQVL